MAPALDLDLSLYLVTDSALLRGRRLANVVTAAIRGGVTCVQLRDKTADRAELLVLARELLTVTQPAGVPLIINDRADVAAEAGADGVHVGQGDLPPAEARRLIGPAGILGVTAATPEQARQAAADGADYIGTSGVFETPTKADVGRLTGLEGLAELCRAVAAPVVAIGGVDASNAAAMIEAGAAGVAVVRAIMAAEDPEAAAAELRRAVDAARRDGRR